MKQITKTILMATMAVAAFGAEARVGFQVEFPFLVGKTVMPAGAYTIQRFAINGPVLKLENVASKTAVLVPFANTSLAKADETRNEVEFECSAQGCAISKVSNLVGGAVFHNFKAKGPQGKLVSVKMSSAAVKAD